MTHVASGHACGGCGGLGWLNVDLGRRKRLDCNSCDGSGIHSDADCPLHSPVKEVGGSA